MHTFVRSKTASTRRGVPDYNHTGSSCELPFGVHQFGVKTLYRREFFISRLSHSVDGARLSRHLRFGHGKEEELFLHRVIKFGIHFCL